MFVSGANVSVTLGDIPSALQNSTGETRIFYAVLSLKTVLAYLGHLKNSKD